MNLHADGVFAALAEPFAVGDVCEAEALAVAPVVAQVAKDEILCVITVTYHALLLESSWRAQRQMCGSWRYEREGERKEMREWEREEEEEEEEKVRERGRGERDKHLRRNSLPETCPMSLSRSARRWGGS